MRSLSICVCFIRKELHFNNYLKKVPIELNSKLMFQYYYPNTTKMIRTLLQYFNPLKIAAIIHFCIMNATKIISIKLLQD